MDTTALCAYRNVKRLGLSMRPSPMDLKISVHVVPGRRDRAYDLGVSLSPTAGTPPLRHDVCNFMFPFLLLNVKH
jgi:hypothetical protein